MCIILDSFPCFPCLPPLKAIFPLGSPLDVAILDMCCISPCCLVRPLVSTCLCLSDSTPHTTHHTPATQCEDTRLSSVSGTGYCIVSDKGPLSISQPGWLPILSPPSRKLKASHSSMDTQGQETQGFFCKCPKSTCTSPYQVLL